MTCFQLSSWSILDQSCTLTVTTPSGQVGVGVAVTVARRVKMLRVGVGVLAVGEGVAAAREGVPAGAVGEGEGVCPLQAVANPSATSSANTHQVFKRIKKTYTLQASQPARFPGLILPAEQPLVDAVKLGSLGYPVGELIQHVNSQ
jgi:hypothetical protein